MDNARLDITDEGIDSLKRALAIAFSHHSTATHWAVIDNTLVLFWVKPPERCTREWKEREFVKELPAGRTQYIDRSQSYDIKAESFVVPIDAERAAANVHDWLTLKGGANYGEQPDHDGDNGKGWRVFNESWGHVFGMYQAICAVQPAWAMYGK
jgi:hypothetical protein